MTSPRIVIRDLDGQVDMRAVEDLQRDVWGLPDLDVVPLTQLVAARAAGGVVVGAFDGNELAGFAYGFVGLEDGQVTHHSHMLAVRSEYRGDNVGYLLKLAQRERVLKQGIDRMTWTFDPLQSVNAYFNFRKLGVVSDRYFVNFYGEDAASFLHQNGTDRLWVTWPLASERVVDRLNAKFEGPGPSSASPLLLVGDDDGPRRGDSAACLSGKQIVIEIPANIGDLETHSGDLPTQWREDTRWAFTTAIDEGFTVEDFIRAERNGRQIGRYVLVRQE